LIELHDAQQLAIAQEKMAGIGQIEPRREPRRGPRHDAPVRDAGEPFAAPHGLSAAPRCAAARCARDGEAPTMALFC
jgi:hypothetical protein